MPSGKLNIQNNIKRIVKETGILLFNRLKFLLNAEMIWQEIMSARKRHKFSVEIDSTGSRRKKSMGKINLQAVEERNPWEK